MRTKMLVLPILLLLASGLHSDTIHVPSEYSTIQEGLNAAQAGDTVLVASGTYIENLIWPNTQSIKLLSESGPEYTIIDGNNLASVINISVSIDIDTSTVISGYTIRNGNGNSGGGINSYQGLSIIGNHINDNHAIYGGGGINMGAFFTDYSDHEDYRSIYSSSEITQGNRDAKASAIYGVISDCVISGNTSSCGGGILGQNFSGIITKCDISENESSAGAGISLRDHFGTVSQSFLIDSTNIANNTGDGILMSKYLPSPTETYAAHYCNIYGNTGYGITMTGIGAPPSQPFDATYNWWGDPSGPGGVGPGTGDEVCENVLYDPWLTELGIESSSPSFPLRLSVFPNPFPIYIILAIKLIIICILQLLSLSFQVLDWSQSKCLIFQED